MKKPKIKIETYGPNTMVYLVSTGALHFPIARSRRSLAIAAAKEYLLSALGELDALAETVEPGDLKDRETCERKGE